MYVNCKTTPSAAQQILPRFWHYCGSSIRYSLIATALKRMLGLSDELLFSSDNNVYNVSTNKRKFSMQKIAFGILNQAAKRLFFSTLPSSPLRWSQLLHHLSRTDVFLILKSCVDHYFKPIQSEIHSMCTISRNIYTSTGFFSFKCYFTWLC